MSDTIQALLLCLTWFCRYGDVRHFFVKTLNFILNTVKMQNSCHLRETVIIYHFKCEQWLTLSNVEYWPGIHKTSYHTYTIVLKEKVP
jgi:hypothetical protein